MYLFIVALLSLSSVIFSFSNYFLGCVLLILSGYLLYLNKYNIRAKEIIFLIIIFLAFFIRTNFAINNHYSKLENKNAEFNVEIVDPVKINGDYLKGTGYIDNEKIIFKYKIKSKEEKEFFQKKFVGGELVAVGSLDNIQEKKNFYSFDYKKYSENNSVYKELLVEEIISVTKKFSSKFKEFQSSRLEKINDIYNRIIFNKQGYFEALIYGDKSNLLNDDNYNFRLLGINHILVISGLHIASLVSLIYFLLKLINLKDNIIEKVIVILLPVYAVFVGLQPSVLRAAGMIIIYIILKKRNISTIYSLLITFLIMIMYNPYYVLDISFQYSFFITFSLIMSSDFLQKDKNKFLISFRVSFISTLASIPISMMHFYSYSYISVITNIVFVPLFTIIIFPLVVISYLVFLASIDLFNFLFVPLLNLAFSINDKFENLFTSFATYIYSGKQSQLFILLIIILTIYILICLSKNKIKQGVFLLTLLIVLPYVHNKVVYKEYLEKINIGNREQYYIRYGNENILVNTGNNVQDFYNDYRKKIQTYDIINEYNNLFAHEGKRTIDKLIITKTTVKDIGYARTLIGKEIVKELIIPEQLIDHKNIKEIIDIARFKNINIVKIKRNTKLNLNVICFVNYNNSFIINYKNTDIEINKEK